MANMSFGDAARGNLRTLIATIDREITQLAVAGDGPPPTAGLRASWTELVAVLALGPAPETRQCPVCNSTGFSAASRCGNCWAKLVPVMPAGHAAAIAPPTTTTTTAAAAGSPS